MKVLVACEFSGIVRDAFLERGHDAISCDLLPTERPGPHIQGDVRPLLRERWDLVIAHPPCTYLANSGVRWLHERPERWREMEGAAQFFLACLQANGRMVAVENPTMHKYALSIVGRAPNCAVQPYEFGHQESKRTCFWTRGLPPLMPTGIMQVRNQTVHRESPGPDRWKKRSLTFPGIAAAMADQWGRLTPL